MNIKFPVDKHDMSLLDRMIWFFLSNKIIVILLVLFVVAWGILVAPFDWNTGGVSRSPVPVDAIPDIGENQQIVFTKWLGRSPQDVDDQITYPLTVSLMGIPGVKTIRSYSMLGFSTIYIIFKENIDFYWSRSRVVEKLNSLPAGTLPSDVSPALGPDATALGQVYWYTLEGRDPSTVSEEHPYGEPVGGWDLHELRTIQDWNVRYSLLSADGVSEVASAGGFVQEYQIDVDPDAMRTADVNLEEVIMAVKLSNIDVGARTIEVNNVEYLIRGIGFVKNLTDIEQAVIKTNSNIPLYVKDVAHVTLGPALRRGALDKEGTEAVGGVVVVRYGNNPLATIKNVKEKIKAISGALPRRTLPDGRVSQVTIVPFYDRTGLIYETLGTLNTALTEEILVTIIVILVMILHLRSSMLIAGMLPLAVLICFIAMKTFRVDANIVSLSGIAIAIGTIVDMGIIICENIIKRLAKAKEGESTIRVVFLAAREVGSAVITAVSTTIVSFLPVFTMTAAEGKLFRPLAFTKTFALLGSIIIALFVIPALAHMLFSSGFTGRKTKKIFFTLLALIGLTAMFTVTWWAGLIVLALALYRLGEDYIPDNYKRRSPYIITVLAVLAVGLLLSRHWLPLGPEKGMIRNLIFVGFLIGGLLGIFYLFQRLYVPILAWVLMHKKTFLSIPLFLIFTGGLIWLGFDSFFGWLPQGMKTWGPVSVLKHTFPGLGKEFMPPLDEGSYLFMPTTMPHASIGEAMDVLRKQDMLISAIPEVDSAVGKIGRADTPLDPAPLSMIETIINYKSEYITDKDGSRRTFAFDPDGSETFKDMSGKEIPAPDGKPYLVQGIFERDDMGMLKPDPDGKPYRLWRPALEEKLNTGRAAWKGIENPDDIWNEILAAAEITGTTSAPRLQPISARIVMLQSGMRAPMGIKIKGESLQQIEKAGLQIETLLKSGAVPAVNPSSVLADRIVGKPYLEIQIDRNAIARYGIKLQKVQNIIETAIGGMPVTATVEGRERYPVRVRYKRELRDSIEELGNILVPAPDGTQIPLSQISTTQYIRGPQVIKSEDTRLVGYVLFDKRADYAEVDAVEQVKHYLEEQEKIFETGHAAAARRALSENRELSETELENLPGFNRRGTEYVFAGSYENQIRAQKKLSLVLPLSLFIIFMILYLQFRSVITSLLVFSTIILTWSGGFIMLWLYGQDWFLDFSIFGTGMRELFQVHPYNLSVAVWVGFLALFGIASDDGVVIATYLDQVFDKRKPSSRSAIHAATIEAGKRRVRPCLMTSATTILALLPVLTSTGRGSDIMVPMALPGFGGMMLTLVYIFLVPVLYTIVRELKLKGKKPEPEENGNTDVQMNKAAEESGEDIDENI